ncbi:hypothetical protein [Cellulomonas fulva]|uniref:hypothetical protein n=1 Tax=Cellulomonas fulva TaxID=2835530 RepID=UPI0027DD48B4|nr:hypothetical protein [Cellulomonas fulva]
MPHRLVEHPRVYADGSALTRYLPGAPEAAPWGEWAAAHGGELLTTPLGLTELRGTARQLGQAAQEAAHQVTRRVEVVRYFDQAVARASDVAGVATPFVALHAGVALGHPDVTRVATYDARLARLVALYGLEVVAPGRAPRWWESDPTPWRAGPG